jgi:hypothetical protein
MTRQVKTSPKLNLPILAARSEAMPPMHPQRAASWVANVASDVDAIGELMTATQSHARHERSGIASRLIDLARLRELAAQSHVGRERTASW